MLNERLDEGCPFLLKGSDRRGEKLEETLSRPFSSQQGLGEKGSLNQRAEVKMK